MPTKIVNLIKAFYSNFKCTVCKSTDMNSLVKFGVRQGCVMSSLLFILAVDWVMRSTRKGENTDIRWNLLSNLEDLDYADDPALLSHLETHMQSKISKL